jgi:hypothetical protein
MNFSLYFTNKCFRLSSTPYWVKGTSIPGELIEYFYLNPGNKRCAYIEEILLEQDDLWYAYRYVEYVIKGRWVELEPILMEKDEVLYEMYRELMWRCGVMIDYH